MAYALQTCYKYPPGLIDMDGTERTHSTLRIGNETEADQGKIWCVAEYEGGMHDSDKADLTVVGMCVCVCLCVCDMLVLLFLIYFVSLNSHFVVRLTCFY